MEQEGSGFGGAAAWRGWGRQVPTSPPLLLLGPASARPAGAPHIFPLSRWLPRLGVVATALQKRTLKFRGLK